MKNSDDKNKLISDTGVVEDSKVRRERIFILLCRIITVLLVLLGVLALMTGNA
jgi:hypothetical protein